MTTAYKAITDPSIKRWHLGTAERANVSVCGSVLITPGDTRPWAMKVAEADRNYTASDDLTLVGCGLCKRTREYAYATGAAERPAPATRRTRRNVAAATAAATGEGTGDVTASTTGGLTATEARQMAEAAAERNGDAALPPSQQRRPRKSAAQRKADRAAADRAKLLTGADATLAAIEASVAEVTGERGSGMPDHTAAQLLTDAVAARARRGKAPKTGDPRADRAGRPMSRAAKARALVEAGECATLKDARAYLADMGE
jgi:hypothetical protein